MKVPRNPEWCDKCKEQATAKVILRSGAYLTFCDEHRKGYGGTILEECGAYWTRMNGRRFDGFKEE